MTDVYSPWKYTYILTHLSLLHAVIYYGHSDHCTVRLRCLATKSMERSLMCVCGDKMSRRLIYCHFKKILTYECLVKKTSQANSTQRSNCCRVLPSRILWWMFCEPDWPQYSAAVKFVALPRNEVDVLLLWFRRANGRNSLLQGSLQDIDLWRRTFGSSIWVSIYF
jgi:hypothetical protein